MSLFLDTQETSQRFGNHVSEFRSLLETNHIPHGSPEDIFRFAKRLENSTQFRHDLSAMVKSVVQREGEEMMLTDMMGVIATAVGGASFEDTHLDITVPNTILMEFLLGTGCWRHFGLPSSPVSKSAESTRVGRVPTEGQQPTQSSAPASAVPGGDEDPKDLSGLLDRSSELRQMLSQLEANAQQIKRHLDSIEQRISSMEAPAVVVPVETPPAPAPMPDPSSADTVAGEVAQRPPKGVPVFDVELPIRGGRAVFSDQPEPSPAHDFQSPTFAYATEERRGIVPVWVFLALLAIVAASLFFAHSGQGQGLLEAGMSRLQAVRAQFSGGPAAVPPAPAANLPATPTPPPPESVAKTPSPGASPAATRSVTEMTLADPAASDSADARTSSDDRPIVFSPKIRYVPANVMEGYLLSAPRPQYPTVARANHIEGNVALRATISKSGSIETLHVIKGPQPLLGAAIDAVRNWQYKPYSVAGQPVEVTTIVYVDFALRRPPAKAY
jgi:TonB family protein